ncbi:putative RNA pseudouridylate synthase [Trypanosoma grayi]|uniref:putative RNA pseudouridylate synthase n=1 Tax=Trypanosoma grayi TaxID=71804 RepID=UPI0004F46D8B|nr:putative RNA pseudouridylate synthase [Trypanosoma grayi]KEG10366.1 putative RNA pseudouridylate synthase [Trypanosoma grayi]
MENLSEPLERVRSRILYTLFSPVADYAAFQEYCTELVVQLGSLLAPPVVMRVAVRTLFCPPSLRHFYDLLGGRRVPTESVCRQLWWGSPDAAEDVESSFSCLSPKALAAFERLRSDATMRKEFFTSKSASLRNYHVSTWIENCSKVETLEGLLQILVKEVNEYGPPLLAPEAAAALLTAVVLPHLAANKGETTAARGDVIRALGLVYFILPADRAFGAASYFKGVYNERYIASAAVEWTADWDGAEALLVGRSLRQVTKYPTTTQEAFFRIERRRQQPTVSFHVPELRLCLMTVDLDEALRFFESQEKRQSCEMAAPPQLEKEEESDRSPAIVARNLPMDLIAVRKPAEMSTTLHAGYPHLIGFLARHVPWRGASTPILFQHGLINRIDVGTSGLVLVSDTEASLMAARRASVVDQRVEKTYRALLLHCPPPASRMGTEECWYLNPTGTITRSVLANGADYSLQLAAHDPAQRGGLPVAWMDLRPATTMYRVLQYFPRSGVYDVEVQLRSGRRHQIRQHFAQLWHPLVGDGRYHERAKSVGEQLGLQRPALHASRITLLSSPAAGFDAIGGEKTVVECPLPSDMRRALRLLEEREGMRLSATSP